MPPPLRSSAGILFRAAGIILVSGLVGATLMRVAPGFGADEMILDPRLSSHTVESLLRGDPAETNPLVFYFHFLRGLARGNAGWSEVFGQPVSVLVKDRAATTVAAVSGGLALAWSAALLLASVAALSRRRAVAGISVALNAGLLSIPSAVLATMCLLLGIPAAAAIGAVVFPRVFPHVYEQLRAACGCPHVLHARARGLRGARLYLFHVASAAWPPIFAAGGVSVTLAFGASVPIEALADSPGLGQLAWRAALGRDLPTLVTVTLLLTAVTVLANAAIDLVLVRSSGAPR